MQTPEQDRACQQRYRELLPGLPDYIDHWAKIQPQNIAIEEFATGAQVTWKDLSRKSTAFAALLLARGLRKGDVVATSLPLLKEHLYLIFACLRIGAIIAPLDLRLKFEEVDRYFKKIQPKAYFFLGQTPAADFRPMVTALHERHRLSIPNWVQFQREPDLVIPGAEGIADFARRLKWHYVRSLVTGSVRRAHRQVSQRDPAVIIFTTGSTGASKPALLCQENILAQCIGMVVGFGVSGEDRLLINLPPSHVGCLTEQVALAAYAGCTSIILPIFKARDSLEAISRHKATLLGQIPAMYQMEWLLPDYATHDLSSLRLAAYGGQAVSSEFLTKLIKMAPLAASGLGLTETAGFCTYTPLCHEAETLSKSLGWASPLCPLSVREPMGEDGTAGVEKAAGEVGEICFSGPQVFLGYLNDKANTRGTISSDGICYTGDMGRHDASGLHLAGRRKHMIKPKGYQVFPGEVENYLASHLGKRVSSVACVGAPHEIYSEAIVVFIEVADEHTVSREEVLETSRGLAAYARPLHVEILSPGGMPLNRVVKTDYLVLQEWTQTIVAGLQARGEWDRAAGPGNQ